MSRKHAILSPSGASKWLACTPSARLEAKAANTTSDAAAEGTLAHSLGELIISFRTQAITAKKYREQLAIIEQAEYYNKAMYEYCDGYAVYVLEQLSAAKAHTPSASLFIEQRLRMTEYIPEGFGTGDAGIIADGYLDIIDLKYGKGVAVSAVDNPQLKVYALGWLAEFDHVYDIHTIRLHIYQPRLGNISVHEVPQEQLTQWAENVLKPKAAQAYKGEGDFAAGKHCQFCRVKTTCKANRDYQLEIAANDFAECFDGDTTLLTDDDIAEILSRADAFKSWVNAVEEYALAEALKGKKWPGYKLVNGRSKRTITDKEAVAKLLVKEGFDRTKIYKPQELVGITDMEKLTGKKWFDSNVSQYTVKQPGAPTLAPADDKRAEYNSAGDDFKDLV